MNKKISAMHLFSYCVLVLLLYSENVLKTGAGIVGKILKLRDWQHCFCRRNLVHHFALFDGFNAFCDTIKVHHVFILSVTVFYSH
jgi:hypothetical protein